MHYVDSLLSVFFSWTVGVGHVAITASHPSDVPVEILPMEEFTCLESSRWNGTGRQARLSHIESFWGLADPAFCDVPGAESFQTLLDRVDRTLARFEALSLSKPTCWKSAIDGAPQLIKRND